jgi:hypothetical protein
MLLDDDVMRDGKAQPCSLPGRLGGEERIEHLLPHLGQDTGAVVEDPDLDCLAEAPCGDAENRLKAFITGFNLAPGRGVEAVGNQIKQRTRDFLRIKLNRPYVERSVWISLTTLTCLLRITGYGTYPAGATFGGGRRTL